MPYVPRARRGNESPPENAGDLHYDVSQVLNRYLFHRGKPPRYQDFNDVMGALAAAQAEIYRRFIAPYEDAKIAENGDVYAGPDNVDDDGDRPASYHTGCGPGCSNE